MKGKLNGKSDGFSTLELMIALALISIALVGTISGNFASQYWSLMGQTSNEGLYRTKTKLEDMRSLIKQDFYSVTSSTSTPSMNSSDPEDTSCIDGGLCYFIESNIVDVSSCSKFIEAKTKWKIQNYPENYTYLFTNLTNSQEIINLGGDCLLNIPSGNWETNTPTKVGQQNYSPSKKFTSIDVLHKKIYTTAETYPAFLIFSEPTSVGSNPELLGSYDLKHNNFSLKINDIDVIEDLSSGRKYAFVAVATTTNQLAVFDVTDSSSPGLKAQVTLQGVDPSGSYPEGYKLYVYGQRLYITTRETVGNELHIFDITTPTDPSEIGNGYELNRTVNDMTVRDQKINGKTKRLLFLASDSNVKEFSILDITNDSINEINFINLPGIQDGLSLNLVGQNVYFGRQSNSTGPELFVFNISNPDISIPIINSAETGASILGIKVSGNFAFIATNKSGEEFQIWDSNFSNWSPSALNSSRYKFYPFTNIASQGFDVDNNWIYIINNTNTKDKIEVIFTSP